MTGQKYIHPCLFQQQTLPDAISRCRSLKTLEADNNELGSLPAALADVAIQRLSLRRNRLSSVSGSVDAFLAPSGVVATPPGSLLLARSIRELDLSSNGMLEVPEAVFVCRGLQVRVVWCVCMCMCVRVRVHDGGVFGAWVLICRVGCRD